MLIYAISMMSLTKENIYSIQLNLASSVQKLSVVAMCYSLFFVDLSPVSFMHAYKMIHANF